MNLLSGRTRTRRLFTAGLIAVALVATACGGDDDGGGPGAVAPTGGVAGDLYAAAQEEGQLTVISTLSGQSNDALQKAWDSAFPDVELQLVTGDSVELQPRLAAEMDSGNVQTDAIMTASRFFLDEELAKGHWTPLQIPAMQEAIWKPFIGGNGTYLTTYHSDRMTIAWNTEAVPDGIKTWQDVLDPKYKDRIGTPGPDSSQAAHLLIYLEEKLGTQWFEAFARQVCCMYTNATSLNNALIAGEVDLAVPAEAQALGSKRDGAPVDIVWPGDIGQIGALNAVAIPVKAPHPKAAQFFAHFLTTPAGQNAINVDRLTVLDPAEVPDASGQVSPDFVSAGAPEVVTREELQVMADRFTKLVNEK